jgi:protein gp37
MADKTAIAWCCHTFNPWIGCHKVSQGCTHCYAEALVTKRMGEPGLWGLTGGRRRTSKALWRKPLKWNLDALMDNEPARVFCASLADVFEDRVDTNAWRPEVFDLIRSTPWLDWQLLTKRPENLARMLPDDWGDGYPNVWLGTSIENNAVVHRASELTSVPSYVHFVSYEPAIGPLDELPLADIEWVIVGGESGPGYRHMDLSWAHDMRRRCRRAGTAFFFKQDSAPRTEMGIGALGAIYRDYPRSAPRWE